MTESSFSIPIVDTAPPSARFGRRWREAAWGYLLIAPVMIGFAVFFLIALGASLYLSFTRWDMLTSPVFVGLDNYRTVLHDHAFRTALLNTVAITVPHIVLRLICALALAISLNSNIRFRAI
jgi:multiple sugar transport system permease protein